MKYSNYKIFFTFIALILLQFSNVCLAQTATGKLQLKMAQGWRSQDTQGNEWRAGFEVLALDESGQNRIFEPDWQMTFENQNAEHEPAVNDHGWIGFQGSESRFCDGVPRKALYTYDDHYLDEGRGEEDIDGARREGSIGRGYSEPAIDGNGDKKVTTFPSWLKTTIVNESLGIDITWVKQIAISHSEQQWHCDLHFYYGTHDILLEEVEYSYPAPYFATINGPRVVRIFYAGYSRTWTSQITGGAAPYNYKWYRLVHNGSGSSEDLVGTSPDYTHIYPTSPPGNFSQYVTLRLEVKDNNNDVVTDTHTVLEKGVPQF